MERYDYNNPFLTTNTKRLTRISTILESNREHFENNIDFCAQTLSIAALRLACSRMSVSSGLNGCFGSDWPIVSLIDNLFKHSSPDGPSSHGQCSQTMSVGSSKDPQRPSTLTPSLATLTMYGTMFWFQRRTNHARDSSTPSGHCRKIRGPIVTSREFAFSMKVFTACKTSGRN